MRSSIRLALFLGILVAGAAAASVGSAQTTLPTAPPRVDCTTIDRAQMTPEQRRLCFGDPTAPDPDPGQVVYLPDLLADLFGRVVGGGGRDPLGPRDDPATRDPQTGDPQTGDPQTGDPSTDPNDRRPVTPVDDPDDGGGRVAVDGTPVPPLRPDRDTPRETPSGPSAPPSAGGGTSTTAPLAARVRAIRPAFPVRAVAGAHVPDEVLVTIAGNDADAAAIASSFGLELLSQRQSVLLGSTLARYRIPDGRTVGLVLAQLAGDPRTTGRVPNHIYDLQQAATVVNYAFQRIALDSRAASGADIRVAVIDSAIDDTHPALSGVVVETYDGMPDQPVVTRDHATSVSGLIAGVGPYRGIAPGALIHHARAFEGGTSTMDILLASLDWSAESGVDIINMSFVGPRNDLFELACDTARDLGIVLVAAAGNNGPAAPFGFPAAYESVIAVTATDARDRLMAKANRGSYVFVAAPGVDMLAPIPGGSDVVTGTSFAAAIVSGAIANLLRSAADRSPGAIERLLSDTAHDLGPEGFDNDFGYGLIDTAAAMERRR